MMESSLRLSHKDFACIILVGLPLELSSRTSFSKEVLIDRNRGDGCLGRSSRGWATAAVNRKLQSPRNPFRLDSLSPDDLDVS